MKKLYSVDTDMINPYYEEDRYICDFMCSCKGFVALQNTPDCEFSMWLFDSKENARRARNLALSQGIDCQDEIRIFEWDEEETCVPVQ